ncbi:MAG TPA: polysaccharide deacetylase family protein [Chloroflexota bacterium]
MAKRDHKRPKSAGRFHLLAALVISAFMTLVGGCQHIVLARAGGPARVISIGPARAHAVALTFDAGADRGYAGRILSTLEAERIHASFGMTGLWAEANPDLVRRMARDGDQLINHTYNHRSFTGVSTNTAPLSAAQRTWEIQKTAAIIRKLTRRSVAPWFRPPYGDYDRATLSLLGRLGYTYQVMWTIDSLGWDHLPASAIIQRCVARIRYGAIILMHVGSQSQDAFALDPVIKQLRRSGYRFLTVAGLLKSH